MRPNLGCDLVHIPTFAERVASGGEAFLDRIFLPHEREGASVERLAGTFAAKEAAIKALRVPAGNWLRLEVVRGDDGAPHLLVDAALHPHAADIQLSISHDGDYAMAVVLAL